MTAECPDAIPAAHLQAPPAARQGRILELEYTVRHYINRERKLVIAPGTDGGSAGRETVSGPPIVKRCNVYVPAGCRMDDPAVRYPVLYLLHGVGGDHFEWLHGSGTEGGRPVICNLIDHLVISGDIEPVIVVFPNGRSAWNWQDKTFDFTGTNMLGFYYFDYELRHDLMPFIESRFPVRARSGGAGQTPEEAERARRQRAVAGLSMGGMQALNLVLGGFRHDAAKDETGEPGRPGLRPTVLAPGMLDLFGAVGSFSCAPTSSEGRVLGSSIKAAGQSLHALYMNCGDRDDISFGVFRRSTDGLAEHAGGLLRRFVPFVVRDGVHDFRVWNLGAWHFLRLAFPAHGDRE